MDIPEKSTMVTAGTRILKKFLCFIFFTYYIKQNRKKNVQLKFYKQNRYSKNIIYYATFSVFLSLYD